MNGLAPHTGLLFDQLAKLECIKPYLLVGGTALSMQIDHRQSEDLDFMKWRTSREESMEVEWAQIKKELATIGTIEEMNLVDIDHVMFTVSGVKVSFYASPRYTPVTHPVHIQDNLYAADLLSIGAMKMEVLLRRSNFRDYYDIYSLIRYGVDFQSMVDLALKHSGHVLHTKNLYSMLTNGSRFQTDANFSQLQPQYSVTAAEIEQYISEVIKKESR